MADLPASPLGEPSAAVAAPPVAGAPSRPVRLSAAVAGRWLRRGLIAVGGAGLVVLIWLWHGKTEPSPMLAQAAAPAQPPRPNAQAGAAAERPQVIFNWTDAAGIPHRAAVPKDEYQDYLRTVHEVLDHDREDAALLAAQTLNDQIDPLFDQMQTRVSRYADWAFDWWTSWILLGRAFAWSWDSLRHGHVLSLPDRVQARLTDTIRQRFRDLALRPETTDPQLAAAVAQAMTEAGAALARNCAASQTALADFVRRAARRTERRDPSQGWVPDAGWDPARASFQPVCAAHALRAPAAADYHATLAVANASAPVEEVVLRLARPFATKLISFVVLPGIVAAIVGGIVLPLFGLLPNIISGVITGILTGAFGAMLIGFAASASVDLLLARSDEALNRPQFEATARKAVVAVQADFEKRALAAEHDAIAATAAGLVAGFAGDAPSR